MKKILLFLFTLSVLASCSSTDEAVQVDEVTWLVSKNIWSISIWVPANWNTIASSNLPIPKSWEVVLAIASSEQRENYLNNLVILKASNSLNESSQSLMKNSANFLDTKLQSFRLVEEKDIVFSDEEGWLIITFEWKYNTQTPLVTYIQTARVCGEDSYFATISLSEKPESYDKYITILKTLKCS